MTGKIAKTSFQTGPDDKVAVVDLYRTNTATVVNGVVTEATSAASDSVNNVKALITDQVNAAKEALADTFSVKSLTAIARDGLLNGGFDKDALLSNFSSLAMSKSDALAKLRDAVDGPLNSITNLDNLKTNLVTNMLGSIGFTDNPESLAKGLLGLPGSTDPINVLLDGNPKLKIIHGAATMMRDSKDTDSAKGLVSLLNSVTGNSDLAKVLDMESQFAVLGQLVDTASVFGIPQIIDNVLDKLDSDDEKAKFLLTTADKAFANSDINLLGKILDLNDPSLIDGKVGDSVSSLLSNYRLPLGFDKTITQQYTDALTALVTLLNRLNPNWSTIIRNGVSISNLGPFMACSQDAIIILSRSPLYQDNCIIAGSYIKDSMLSISVRNFPWLSDIIN